MSAGPHGARRFAKQTVGRQAEIQTVLHHHDIGSVFTQRPGLLFADNLDAGQRRAKAHVALHLRRGRRGLGRWPVMHQITAEEPPQFVFEHAPLFIEQQLPERAGQPFTGCADQGQPVRISLCERFITHRILQSARNY